jgi:hypothetical protein
MALRKDKYGVLHKGEGMCADCGRTGKFIDSVKVPGKGPFGSNKPLAVYACADHRNKG